MPAPTLLNFYEDDGDDSTYDITIVSSLSVQPGDLLVVMCTNEGDGQYVISENGAGSFTTLVDGYGNTETYLWVYEVTTSESITVTVTQDWTWKYFYVCLGHYRNTGGYSVYGNDANTSGDPSLTLNSCSANSAIQMIVGDWNAVTGTQLPYEASAGTFTAGTGFPGDNTHYGVFAGVYEDAGASGNKTIGQTDPNGLDWTIVGVEILGNPKIDVDSLVAEVGYLPDESISVASLVTEVGYTPDVLISVASLVVEVGYSVITGTDTDSSTPAYMDGQDNALDDVPAYVVGESTASDSTPAHVVGEPYSSISAYLWADSYEEIIPSSDVYDGNWVDDQGGTELFTPLTDDSDATYVQHEAPAVNEYFEVALANPIGDPDTDYGLHTIEFRACNLLSEGTIEVQVQLRQGASTVIATTSETLTASWQDYSYQLTSGEVASITDYDDLRLRFVLVSVS